MSDGLLRELEARWRRSGAAADEAAWLQARVRAGLLSPARLWFAGSLGHAPAAQALGGQVEPPLRLQPPPREDFVPEFAVLVMREDPWARRVLAHGPALAARLGVAAAHAAMPSWLRVCPEHRGWAERRIAVFERAVACPCPEHESAVDLDPDNPAREELMTRGDPYERRATLADRMFWSYKEGLPEDVATMKVFELGHFFAGQSGRLVPPSGFTEKFLHANMTLAAYVVGLEPLLERLRSDLVPFALGTGDPVATRVAAAAK